MGERFVMMTAMQHLLVAIASAEGGKVIMDEMDARGVLALISALQQQVLTLQTDASWRDDKTEWGR